MEEPQNYQDPNNPTEFEQKHVPVIEVDTTIVSVKIGEVAHPMEESHYIQWIELLIDGNSHGKTSLQPNVSAKTEFEVDLNGVKEVKVQALCNLHGLWENTIKLDSK